MQANRGGSVSLKTEFIRLREVDWRELDIKEAGSWPLVLQLLCCFFAFVLPFSAVYFYYVGPAKESMIVARNLEEKLITEYRVKAAKVANLEVMNEQMGVLEVRIEELREMLPTGAEVPSLLDSISEAAIDNKLEIDYLRLRSSQALEHYVERPFDIQVRGGYHQIANFLSDVASMPRIVTMHELVMAPDDEDFLVLSLLAKTYSYREQQGSED